MNKNINDYFEAIEVPEELDGMVTKTIHVTKMKLYIRRTIFSSFIVLFVAFVFAVNFIEPVRVYAMESDMLSRICEIFTFNKAYYEDDVKRVSINVPTIELNDTNTIQNQVNKEIQKIVDEEVKTAIQSADEYYEAYIETGGSEEEYFPKEVVIDYDIKYVSDEIASFIIFKYETTAAAYFTNHYYNIDIANDRIITLKDLFGEDYVKVIGAEIAKQIDEMSEDERNMLFVTQDEIYNLIDENRGFYFTDANTVTVVFEKYEIAIGARGIVEFPIALPQN